MDRENANFQAVLNSVRELAPEATFIPVQIPIGEKQDFKGVIDLFSMKARLEDGGSLSDIPAELQAEAEEARIALVEAAAEGDDSLLEKYLEGESLSADEIANGFRQSVRSCRFIPVFVTAASNALGVVPLMEAMVNLLPSPAASKPKKAEGAGGEELLENKDGGALAVYVWKTTADPFVGKLTYLRVFSGSLIADTRVWNHTKGEEERLGTLYIMQGKEQNPVKDLHAGDIGTVAKLGQTADRGYPGR